MTVAIIDGDVVAYMACKNRYYNEDGINVVTLEERIFTEEEDRIYLEGAWLRFQEILQELLEVCFTNSYKMAVKGEGNFRNDIYPEYKANRHADPKKRNPFVGPLRRMAVEAGLAVPAHGMEADDLLRIWQQECVAKNEHYIICSIDKDLRCISGKHYLMHKDTFLDMSEEASLRFYYEQLLKGDPTDNIKGIPKVGDVRAKKYLAAYDTEASYQYIVSEAYQGAFLDDWEKELILNGSLLYLKKSHRDSFTLDGWNLCPYDSPVVAPSQELIEVDKPLYHDYVSKPPEDDGKTWQDLLGYTDKEKEEHRLMFKAPEVVINTSIMKIIVHQVEKDNQAVLTISESIKTVTKTETPTVPVVPRVSVKAPAFDPGWAANKRK